MCICNALCNIAYSIGGRSVKISCVILSSILYSLPVLTVMMAKYMEIMLRRYKNTEAVVTKHFHN